MTSQEIEIAALKAAVAESTRVLELLNSEPRWVPVANADVPGVSRVRLSQLYLPDGYAICRLTQPEVQP